MEEFDYTVEDLEQLCEFQFFYNEMGLCQVLRIVEDVIIYGEEGYECEVIESEPPHLDKEGIIFLLVIGDKIRIT